ncbi:MAG: PAS domain S-box protein [Nitrospinota bacterium]|nr:PAS domain S-box protein [Nitrospinota bacterium]
MYRILASNFLPKDFALFRGRIMKAGKRDFSLFDESRSHEMGKPPDTVLLFWRRGSRAWLAQNGGGPIPVIVVFQKENQSAAREAFALGAADGLLLKELSPHSLRRAIMAARARAGRLAAMADDAGKFEVFMKHAPVVAFIKDKDGRYGYVNKHWEEISSLKRSQVVGKSSDQLWPATTAQSMSIDDREVLATGRDKEVVEWIPVGGSQRLFVTHKFPLPDSSGAACMVAGMSVDITEIESARADRELAERKYRHLFETAMDGIAMVDPETLDFLDVNEIFASRLGYTKEEIVRMKLTQITRNAVNGDGPIMTRLREGHAMVLEREYIRKDGSVMPVEVSVNIADLGGKKVLVGFARDITIRKMVEKALLDTELKYKTVIEAAHDAIFLADAETGILVDANSSAERITGYSRDELIGMHQSRLHPEEHEKEYKGRFRDSVINGRSPEGYVTVKRKNGEVIPMEIGVSLSEIDGRKIIVGIFRDVTKRLKAENEIRRQTDLTRLLKEIAVETNEASAADDAMMTAIRKIREFSGWELGHVYIVGQDDLIRSSGLISCDDPRLESKFRSLAESFVFEPGEGLPGLVCKNGKPLWVRDMVAQSICVRDRSMAQLGLKAAFAFPVLEGKRTAAVLEFFALGMDEPDESMLEAINGLAIQLGRVTERKKINEKLQLAQKIIDSAKEGIVITDDEANIQSVNRAFTEMTGYEPHEVIGLNPRILKSGKHDREFYESMWSDLLTKGSWEGEIWNRRKDGHAFHELLSITAIKDDNGATVKYAAIFNDITDYVSSQKEIEYQAYHDALTGLPNRLLLLDRLKQAMARAQREGDILAIIFLDLDNFKHINDSLGHITGDLMLKGTAMRLVGCLREGDTVSRFGGDEFCALVDNIQSEYEVAEICHRILEELSTPYLFENEELVCTASLGIAYFPSDANSSEDLLKKADLAMYHAKDMGKCNFQFFKSSMNEQYAKRLEIENNLRRAIVEKGMVAYYQPKVSLKSGKIMGMEALVRWKQADGEVVASFDFIRIAEEIGLVYELDRWMMKTAMEFTALLNQQATAANLPMKNIAVNLSAKDLERPEIAEVILRTAQEAGISPANVELEITESAIIKNLDKVESILETLRSDGFNIALDDFGVGYSSMDYIRRLPINIVKIDRSFVMDLESDQDSRLVAKAIITLAHDLGMKVVAEGVETKYQLDFLRQTHCDEMQGFLFSKAVPSDEIESMLDTGFELEF